MNVGEVIHKSCRGCVNQGKEDGTLGNAKILRGMHRRNVYDVMEISR